MPQIPCRHAHKSPQTLPSLSWSSKDPYRHFSESRNCLQHHLIPTIPKIPPAPFASCAVLRHRKEGPGVGLSIPILSAPACKDIDPEEHREAENPSVDGPYKRVSFPSSCSFLAQVLDDTNGSFMNFPILSIALTCSLFP